MSDEPATLCKNCDRVLVAHGRGWVHLDGNYRCTGYAEPIDFNTLVAVNDVDDAYQEAYDRGWNDGRARLADDIQGVLPS